MTLARNRRRGVLTRQIGERFRELRQERGITQSEAAARLRISQPRITRIERGLASFTAEEFLVVLSVFNVTTSYFTHAARDEEAALQNALARQGATHLLESRRVVPSEELDDVNRLIRDGLVARSARVITALAPVVVRNIDRVSLAKVDAQLADLGLDRRLPWFVENLIAAIRAQSEHHVRVRRALVVLSAYLEAISHRDRGTLIQDILDPDIRSERTLRDTSLSASDISRRWGIRTTLTPEDFAESLEAAHALD